MEALVLLSLEFKNAKNDKNSRCRLNFALRSSQNLESCAQLRQCEAARWHHPIQILLPQFPHALGRQERLLAKTHHQPEDNLRTCALYESHEGLQARGKVHVADWYKSRSRSQSPQTLVHAKAVRMS
jgi:hypothetical protein